MRHPHLIINLMWFAGAAHVHYFDLFIKIYKIMKISVLGRNKHNKCIKQYYPKIHTSELGVGSIIYYFNISRVCVKRR